jgi:uncharacterized protein with ATP-grasp and redox domains
MNKLTELHREELEPINREIASIQRQVRNLPEYTHSSIEVTKELLKAKKEELKAKKEEIKAKRVHTYVNYVIDIGITGNSEEENKAQIEKLEAIFEEAASKFNSSIYIQNFGESSQYQITTQSELTD